MSRVSATSSIDSGNAFRVDYSLSGSCKYDVELLLPAKVFLHAHKDTSLITTETMTTPAAALSAGNSDDFETRPSTSVSVAAAVAASVTAVETASANESQSSSSSSSSSSASASSAADTCTAKRGTYTSRSVVLTRPHALFAVLSALTHTVLTSPLSTPLPSLSTHLPASINSVAAATAVTHTAAAATVASAMLIPPLVPSPWTMLTHSRLSIPLDSGHASKRSAQQSGLDSAARAIFSVLRRAPGQSLRAPSHSVVTHILTVLPPLPTTSGAGASITGLSALSASLSGGVSTAAVDKLSAGSLLRALLLPPLALPLTFAEKGASVGVGSHPAALQSRWQCKYLASKGQGGASPGTTQKTPRYLQSKGVVRPWVLTSAPSRLLAVAATVPAAAAAVAATASAVAAVVTVVLAAANDAAKEAAEASAADATPSKAADADHDADGHAVDAAEVASASNDKVTACVGVAAAVAAVTTAVASVTAATALLRSFLNENAPTKYCIASFKGLTLSEGALFLHSTTPYIEGVLTSVADMIADITSTEAYLSTISADLSTLGLGRALQSVKQQLLVLISITTSIAAPLIATYLPSQTVAAADLSTSLTDCDTRENSDIHGAVISHMRRFGVASAMRRLHAFVLSAAGDDNGSDSISTTVESELSRSTKAAVTAAASTLSISLASNSVDSSASACAQMDDTCGESSIVARLTAAARTLSQAASTASQALPASTASPLLMTDCEQQQPVPSGNEQSKLSQSSASWWLGTMPSGTDPLTSSSSLGARDRSAKDSTSATPNTNCGVVSDSELVALSEILDIFSLTEPKSHVDSNCADIPGSEVPLLPLTAFAPTLHEVTESGVLAALSSYLNVSTPLDTEDHAPVPLSLAAARARALLAVACGLPLVPSPYITTGTTCADNKKTGSEAETETGAAWLSFASQMKAATDPLFTTQSQAAPFACSAQLDASSVRAQRLHGLSTLFKSARAAADSAALRLAPLLSPTYTLALTLGSTTASPLTTITSVANALNDSSSGSSASCSSGAGAGNSIVTVSTGAGAFALSQTRAQSLTWAKRYVRHIRMTLHHTSTGSDTTSHASSAVSEPCGLAFSTGGLTFVQLVSALWDKTQVTVAPSHRLLANYFSANANNNANSASSASRYSSGYSLYSRQSYGSGGYSAQLQPQCQWSLSVLPTAAIGDKAADVLRKSHTEISKVYLYDVSASNSKATVSTCGDLSDPAALAPYTVSCPAFPCHATPLDLALIDNVTKDAHCELDAVNGNEHSEEGSAMLTVTAAVARMLSRPWTVYSFKPNMTMLTIDGNDITSTVGSSPSSSSNYSGYMSSYGSPYGSAYGHTPAPSALFTLVPTAVGSGAIITLNSGAGAGTQSRRHCSIHGCQSSSSSDNAAASASAAASEKAAATSKQVKAYYSNITTSVAPYDVYVEGDWAASRAASRDGCLAALGSCKEVTAQHPCTLCSASGSTTNSAETTPATSAIAKANGGSSDGEHARSVVKIVISQEQEEDAVIHNVLLPLLQLVSRLSRVLTKWWEWYLPDVVATVDLSASSSCSSSSSSASAVTAAAGGKLVSIALLPTTVTLTAPSAVRGGGDELTTNNKTKVPVPVPVTAYLHYMQETAPLSSVASGGISASRPCFTFVAGLVGRPRQLQPLPCPSPVFASIAHAHSGSTSSSSSATAAGTVHTVNASVDVDVGVVCSESDCELPLLGAIAALWTLDPVAIAFKHLPSWLGTLTRLSSSTASQRSDGGVSAPLAVPALLPLLPLHVRSRLALAYHTGPAAARAVVAANSALFRSQAGFLHRYVSSSVNLRGALPREAVLSGGASATARASVNVMTSTVLNVDLLTACACASLSTFLAPPLTQLHIFHSSHTYATSTSSMTTVSCATTLSSPSLPLHLPPVSLLFAPTPPPPTQQQQQQEGATGSAGAAGGRAPLGSAKVTVSRPAPFADMTKWAWTQALAALRGASTSATVSSNSSANAFTRKDALDIASTALAYMHNNNASANSNIGLSAGDAGYDGVLSPCEFGNLVSLQYTTVPLQTHAGTNPNDFPWISQLLHAMASPQNLSSRLSTCHSENVSTRHPLLWAPRPLQVVLKGVFAGEAGFGEGPNQEVRALVDSTLAAAGAGVGLWRQDWGSGARNGSCHSQGNSDCESDDDGGGGVDPYSGRGDDGDIVNGGAAVAMTDGDRGTTADKVADSNSGASSSSVLVTDAASKQERKAQALVAKSEVLLTFPLPNSLRSPTSDAYAQDARASLCVPISSSALLISAIVAIDTAYSPNTPSSGGASGSLASSSGYDSAYRNDNNSGSCYSNSYVSTASLSSSLSSSATKHSYSSLHKDNIRHKRESLLFPSKRALRLQKQQAMLQAQQQAAARADLMKDGDDANETAADSSDIDDASAGYIFGGIDDMFGFRPKRKLESSSSAATAAGVGANDAAVSTTDTDSDFDLDFDSDSDSDILKSSRVVVSDDNSSSLDGASNPSADLNPRHRRRRLAVAVSSTYSYPPVPGRNAGDDDDDEEEETEQEHQLPAVISAPITATDHVATVTDKQSDAPATAASGAEAAAALTEAEAKAKADAEAEAEAEAITKAVIASDCAISGVTDALKAFFQSAGTPQSSANSSSVSGSTNATACAGAGADASEVPSASASANNLDSTASCANFSASANFADSSDVSAPDVGPGLALTSQLMRIMTTLFAHTAASASKAKPLTLNKNALTAAAAAAVAATAAAESGAANKSDVASIFNAVKISPVFTVTYSSSNANARTDTANTRSDSARMMTVSRVAHVPHATTTSLVVTKNALTITATSEHDRHGSSSQTSLPTITFVPYRTHKLAARTAHDSSSSDDGGRDNNSDTSDTDDDCGSRLPLPLLLPLTSSRVPQNNNNDTDTSTLSSSGVPACAVICTCCGDATPLVENGASIPIRLHFSDTPLVIPDITVTSTTLARARPPGLSFSNKTTSNTLDTNSGAVSTLTTVTPINTASRVFATFFAMVIARVASVRAETRRSLKILANESQSARDKTKAAARKSRREAVVASEETSHNDDKKDDKSEAGEAVNADSDSVVGTKAASKTRARTRTRVRARANTQIATAANSRSNAGATAKSRAKSTLKANADAAFEADTESEEEAIAEQDTGALKVNLFADAAASNTPDAAAPATDGNNDDNSSDDSDSNVGDDSDSDNDRDSETGEDWWAQCFGYQFTSTGLAVDVQLAATNPIKSSDTTSATFCEQPAASTRSNPRSKRVNSPPKSSQSAKTVATSETAVSSKPRVKRTKPSDPGSQTQSNKIEDLTSEQQLESHRARVLRRYVKMFTARAPRLAAANTATQTHDCVKEANMTISCAPESALTVGNVAERLTAKAAKLHHLQWVSWTDAVAVAMYVAVAASKAMGGTAHLRFGQKLPFAEISLANHGVQVPASVTLYQPAVNSNSSTNASGLSYAAAALASVYNNSHPSGGSSSAPRFPSQDPLVCRCMTTDKDKNSSPNTTSVAVPQRVRTLFYVSPNFNSMNTTSPGSGIAPVTSDYQQSQKQQRELLRQLQKSHDAAQRRAARLESKPLRLDFRPSLQAIAASALTPNSSNTDNNNAPAATTAASGLNATASATAGAPGSVAVVTVASCDQVELPLYPSWRLPTVPSATTSSTDMWGDTTMQSKYTLAQMPLWLRDLRSDSRPTLANSNASASLSQSTQDSQSLVASVRWFTLGTALGRAWVEGARLNLPLSEAFFAVWQQHIRKYHSNASTPITHTSDNYSATIARAQSLANAARDLSRFGATALLTQTTTPYCTSCSANASDNAASGTGAGPEVLRSVLTSAQAGLLVPAKSDSGSATAAADDVGVTLGGMPLDDIYLPLLLPDPEPSPRASNSAAAELSESSARVSGIPASVLSEYSMTASELSAAIASDSVASVNTSSLSSAAASAISSAGSANRSAVIPVDQTLTSSTLPLSLALTHSTLFRAGLPAANMLAPLTLGFALAAAPQALLLLSSAEAAAALGTLPDDDDGEFEDGDDDDEDEDEDEEEEGPRSPGASAVSPTSTKLSRARSSAHSRRRSSNGGTVSGRARRRSSLGGNSLPGSLNNTPKTAKTKSLATTASATKAGAAKRRRGGYDFSVATLAKALTLRSPYTLQSPTIVALLTVLSTFSVKQQRRFLHWATGVPRLPPGGLAALSPPLTVARAAATVREVQEAEEKASKAWRDEAEARAAATLAAGLQRARASASASARAETEAEKANAGASSDHDDNKDASLSEKSSDVTSNESLPLPMTDSDSNSSASTNTSADNEGEEHEEQQTTTAAQAATTEASAESVTVADSSAKTENETLAEIAAQAPADTDTGAAMESGSASVTLTPVAVVVSSTESAAKDEDEPTVYLLPTVMTCTHMLRLPDLKTVALVKAKLLRAMADTDAGFQLS